MNEEWETATEPIADASGRLLRLIPNQPELGHMRVQALTDQWWEMGFVDLKTTMSYFCGPKSGLIDINGDGDIPDVITPQQALRFLVDELRDVPPLLTTEDGP